LFFGPKATHASISMVSGASYFFILFLSHFMMISDAATCLNISGNMSGVEG